MKTRKRLRELMRDFGVEGEIVCDGYRQWRIVNAHKGMPNTCIDVIRKEFPFPAWIMNLTLK